MKKAALAALEKNDTHYTHSMGKRELRGEIARYYKRSYNVDVSPEQVLVTSGTSPALLLVFSALLEPGEQVLLSDPYYACYPNFIRYAGGEPLCVPVREEDGFKFRKEDIEARLTPQVRGIMVNSPANPTGNVFSAAELLSIAELAAEGRYLLSDEIYHGLNYGGKDHSVLEFTDRAFVFNGFSKKFAMTGWRLGYVIAPPEFVRPLQTLQQNLFISACSFSQEAAVAALRDCDAQVEEMLAVYDKRRKYLLGRLQQMGIAPAVPPTGAFYMLANVKSYTDDSYAFAFEVLEQAGVAVTPGIDFGPNLEGYLRLSYANSLENIEEGMDRLEAFLAERKRV
ncbi:pyridoxal phosphate-dependent aminotransferase [Dethiobacter alkaliphilus]|uniref:Aminotransferase n=1 Tax=Dethiobacter alkaliphilus AHT 1 TaxID=555088 RepID=C0GJX0_DETAL|nr:pyridoxal phosphate-dependent aminotransferase [Dethiobacter alkaliphilus]EEG76339.1 aminotransferase class I and II [Dethiobacter alkaliphilus AHT 1]